MASRQCEECGSKMPKFWPRKRSGDRMLCDACVAEPRGGLVSKGMQFTAHDSGDGQTVYHCPFCGSGAVIGNSDGTIECEYCKACFTVQVQPQHPNFPQTDPNTGQPIVNPAMPGQIDKPSLPEPPGDEPRVGYPVEDEGPTVGGPIEGEEDAEDDGEENPFAKKSFVTASGAVLDEISYMRHLAMKYSDDREATAQAILAERRSYK